MSARSTSRSPALRRSRITSGQQAKLNDLQAQLNTASTTLVAAQQNADIAVTRGDRPPSHGEGQPGPQHAHSGPALVQAKEAFYLVLALIAGLAIGAAIVVARALVSDRLRNRDDVADAIGAPRHVQHRPPSRPPAGCRPAARRARMRGIDVKRLANHLDGAVVPPGAKRFAALAVVAVDNAPEVVPAVVSLPRAGRARGRRLSWPTFPTALPRRESSESGTRGSVPSTLTAWTYR